MSTFDQFYLGMTIVGFLALYAALAWVVLYTRESPDAPGESQEPPKAEPDQRLAA